MAEKLNEKLKEIIVSHESVTVEFKKAKNELPDSLFETVCAFLNRNGGNIFLGVENSGKITGVDKDAVEILKKRFSDLCNNSNKIEPTVYLNINDYEVDNKIILHIYVHESSWVHRSSGIVYDRNEDGDYKVTTPERIANIYARKQSFYTENKVFPYAEMSDLSVDLIKRVRQMAINNSNKKHIWADMNDEEMLRSLNLIAKDLITGKEGLTLAAILLFGKDTTILSALPHHKTDAIYRVKNLDRYDDRDDIRTNLLDSFDRLMAFIEKHLDDKFYLEGSQRIDVRNKIARELCVNMLIHREFSNPYPAKLIIEKNYLKTENANKAKMIGKINVDFYEPYPKNPKIAKVFKEIGLADELGSGVRNMVKYTKLYSGGVPEWKEDDIFRAFIPLIPQDIPQDTPQDTPQDDMENLIINFCKEPKNMREIMEYIKLKDRKHVYIAYIKPLKEKNKIEMTIPDKPNSKNQKYVSK
ncbi:MAG: putative DNA binding domain-containing protein [Clostridia bacterium]|nr:putative DNA binding domain-containing protein [Clostridia bacterium]